MREDIKDCPFCGRKSISFVISPPAGSIKCPCGAAMSVAANPERYELIGDDIYRRIPKEEGIDIAIRHWNRRA